MPWDSLDADALRRFVRETVAVSWIVDGNGHAVNLPEWERLTGQTAEEVRGSGWTSAVHPEDRARVEAAWNTAVDHHATYNTDYRLRCADGVYRWFNARGIPLLDRDGHALQWIGVVVAIGDQARLRRSVKRRVEADDAPTAILPQALRAIRAMLGLSAEQLADATGLSRSTVRRLESHGDSTARDSSIAPVLAYVQGHDLDLIIDDGVVVGVTARRSDPAGRA
ncbi:PAS domain S-box-containing protein [Sphingomonas guangdongensis]|uniref:histidine kinase n=2 Tax=Sphingomonas guangdongensis TaxID=1141890 RepID=A0A285QCA9_9SPHN|nr:PAS domain S-box-containing protein [Sphingomonas guangdongensis]